MTKVRDLTAAQNPPAASQAASDGKVYSADSGRTDGGVSLYSPNSGKNLPAVNGQPAAEAKTATETKAAVTANTATSAAVCNTSTATSSETVKQDSSQILNEAEQLFNDKDYSGAVDKLNEINR
jgi:hypothetical protein